MHLSISSNRNKTAASSIVPPFPRHVVQQRRHRDLGRPSNLSESPPRRRRYSSCPLPSGTRRVRKWRRRRKFCSVTGGVFRSPPYRSEHLSNSRSTYEKRPRPSAIASTLYRLQPAWRRSEEHTSELQSPID